MNIDRSLNEALRTIPKASATGLVDMENGMMLDIKTTSSHPSEVFDFLAAATKDMFEGDNVIAIEDIFKEARGTQKNKDERYFQEMLVFSTHLLHYFSRLPSNPQIVFGVVCARDANVGLVLVKSRAILKKIVV